MSVLYLIKDTISGKTFFFVQVVMKLCAYQYLLIDYNQLDASYDMYLMYKLRIGSKIG